MSAKSYISSGASEVMERGKANPLLVAIPVGIVAGIVSALTYRYWMDNCRQPANKKAELERKLEQVVNFACCKFYITLFSTSARNPSSTFFQQAQQKIKNLEGMLQAKEQPDDEDGMLEEQQLQKGVGGGGKEIRIWMDGAFDMMHYGEEIFV